MKKLFFLVIAIVALTSCGFDNATFKLSDGQIVEVDQQSLKGYEVGQQIWLIRSYSPASFCEWEILSGFDVGQLGFEPTKDTTFIFHSQGGNYKRRIASGVLLKKW